MLAKLPRRPPQEHNVQSTQITTCCWLVKHTAACGHRTNLGQISISGVAADDVILIVAIFHISSSSLLLLLLLLFTLRSSRARIFLANKLNYNFICQSKCQYSADHHFFIVVAALSALLFDYTRDYNKIARAATIASHALAHAPILNGIHTTTRHNADVLFEGGGGAKV